MALKLLGWQGEGIVRLDGVPFAPGTKVEITISPKLRSEAELTPPHEEAVRPAAGLRWEGNVLVHHGAGAGPSVAELRDERLNRKAQCPSTRASASLPHPKPHAG